MSRPHAQTVALTQSALLQYQVSAAVSKANARINSTLARISRVQNELSREVADVDEARAYIASALREIEAITLELQERTQVP